MLVYISQAFAAFGAGLAASFSPCVYPLIPISVGYLGVRSVQRRERTQRALGFFAGQALAFTALGVAAVLLGEMLGFSSEIPWVQMMVGVFMISMAAASAFNWLPAIFHKLNRLIPAKRIESVGAAVLVGALSAAVASPCTSPIVGGVLAGISQSKDRIWGVSLMFFFALGLSFLFLLIGLGLAQVQHLPRSGPWLKQVNRFSSALLAVAGIYFLAQGFMAMGL